jgi:predicted RNA-binding protein Jag
MRQLLSTIYPKAVPDVSDSFQDALSEAQEAVEMVKQGEEAIELSPQSAYIRRLQHLIAQRSDLSSLSLGKETDRRVRIYKEQK